MDRREHEHREARHVHRVPELARQPAHRPRRELDRDKQVGRDNALRHRARAPTRGHRYEHLARSEVHEGVRPDREQMDPTNSSESVPRKRCRSRSQTGRPLGRTMRVDSASPQTIDAVTTSPCSHESSWAPGASCRATTPSRRSNRPRPVDPRRRRWRSVAPASGRSCCSRPRPPRSGRRRRDTASRRWEGPTHSSCGVTVTARPSPPPRLCGIPGTMSVTPRSPSPFDVPPPERCSRRCVGVRSAVPGLPAGRFLPGSREAHARPVGEEPTLCPR
jgi:hypothetical protein